MSTYSHFYANRGLRDDTKLY